MQNLVGLFEADAVQHNTATRALVVINVDHPADGVTWS